jgi:F-type H+-transporting ATPase subunit delta
MASVASTYARAFADVALDKRLDGEETVAELRAIADLLAKSAELRQVWENPAIPAEQKHSLLNVIAKRGGISTAARNLVAVVIDHRRIRLLPRIVEQVEKELDARLGLAEAEILSVRELGDAEKRALEAQLGKVTGKKIRARYDRDASLLGCAVIRVGSTIYDGSVKGQLERIKEAISA